MTTSGPAQSARSHRWTQTGCHPWRDGITAGRLGNGFAPSLQSAHEAAARKNRERVAAETPEPRR